MTINKIEILGDDNLRTTNTLAKYIAGSVAQRSMVKRALPKEPDVSFFIASMRKI